MVIMKVENATPALYQLLVVLFAKTMEDQYCVPNARTTTIDSSMLMEHVNASVVITRMLVYAQNAQLIAHPVQ